MKFPQHTDTIVIKNGKVTVQGKPIQLFTSTNSNYPPSHGWWAMVLQGGELGVGRLSASGDKLEVVMYRGNDILPVTATRVGSEPVPEIPVEGKH